MSYSLDFRTFPAIILHMKSGLTVESVSSLFQAIRVADEAGVRSALQQVNIELTCRGDGGDFTPVDWVENRLKAELAGFCTDVRRGMQEERSLARGAVYLSDGRKFVIGSDNGRPRAFFYDLYVLNEISVVGNELQIKKF